MFLGMEVEINCDDINCTTQLPDTDWNNFNLEDNSLLYNEFFHNYLLPNVPCIIKSVTNEWKSTKNWVEDDKPNYNYMRKQYGSCNVTVYKCFEKYFNSQQTQKTVLTDYINYLEAYEQNSSEVLYLKDWHLADQFPDDEFYQIPIYFASDWLNEYYTECLTDDYRFVYVGPKDSFTPFHADVFTSYSWSANVCGRKRWLLFPPGEENSFRNELRNLPYDILETNYKDRRYFEVIQNAGEAIFVPSGWYHQVWNLEETISINHNWINGCNIEKMFDAMLQSLKEIELELEDCREMDNFEEHCQVMLKSLFGMNFVDMYEFLKHITTKRLCKNSQYRNFRLGINHTAFDLNKIRTVLTKFAACDANNLEFFKNNVHIDLLEQLNT